MKKILIILFMVAALATAAQAAPVTGFTNLDFDDNTQNIIGGFDEAAYDIPGWQDYNPPLTDAGSESGAWWPTVDGYAAFMASGDGAYNTSSYVIQPGDAFMVDFWGMNWEWTGTGEWTVTLYYDDPANVIGTFVQDDLPPNGSYTQYTSPVIPATIASEGGLLGILFESTGTGIAQMDEITIDKIRLENNSPANEAALISPVLTSADNDLKFIVYDPVLGANDVEVYLTAGDPNAPDLITTITSPGTGQQTVDLTGLVALPADLEFETTYYWKAVGYEPNALAPTGLDPVSGPVWSFTTVPEEPVITTQPSPAYIAVNAGEPNIVLTANGINGDPRWYKDGSPIADAAGVYAGATTNTLTIYNVQLADEGLYTFHMESLLDDAISDPVRVMIHRQTSYYDFESYVFDPDPNYFEDSIDGYKAYLMNDISDAGLPTVTDANQADGPATFPGLYGVLLDNPYADGDPNNQYLRIDPGVVDYEDITIALWLMPKQIQETWTHVWDFGDADGDGPAFFLNADWGATDSSQGYDSYAAISGQNIVAGLDSTNWVDPGKWHYVVVTIGGNTGKIYVDGVWRGTNNGVTVNPNAISTVMSYIGKSAWSGDDEWNGLIDELKIWNYALTNQEVAEAYMAYTGDVYVCDTEQSNGDGLWRYDQGWNDDNGTPEDTGDDVWIGGNNNCVIDLADFAGMARRWLESNQFVAP